MSPKFAPIGMNTLSRPTSFGDISKRTVSKVLIQLQRCRVVRQSEIRTRRFIDGQEVAGHEQVWPAVVVVVEEPGRETATRARHARLRARPR